MGRPLVNGQAYSWVDINVNILGRSVTGITKVMYKDAEEMQDNYGAGNRPVSRSRGKITSEASIELYMSEIEALQQISPTGRLQDLPQFDMIVSYLPAEGKVVTHTIHNINFKENARESTEGSMEIKVEIPLLTSHITWK